MSGLATPQIIINNEVIAIKPNSFTYDEGFGERSVRVKSSGGGSKTIVVTRNVETEMSTCKFVVLTEDTTLAKLRVWLNNLDNNVVQVSDTGFQRTFSQAIITNKPEAALGADGETEIEWMSQPAV